MGPVLTAPAEATQKRANRIRRSSPKIFLHVGEPKTGSTHLQQVMWQNREVLAASGLILPGARPFAHWRATQDLRQVQQRPNDPVGPHAGAWDKLAREALKAPRAAVISHELLAATTEEQAHRALRSFGNAEVHVIVGVRDFASLLPAEWQESIKHRSTIRWQDWLRDVIDHEAVSADRRQFWFWKVHDTLEILRIWSAGLPPERVHVLTVPKRGSDPHLLWHRFAGIVGADHDDVDLEVGGANASLGLAEVELLRRLNAELPPHLPDWFYMRAVKDIVAATALTETSNAERLQLPADRYEWAERESQRVSAGLRASGAHIAGDLADLVPNPPRESRVPGDLSGDELLPPSLTMARALLTAMAEELGIRADPDAEEPHRSWLKRAGIALATRSRLAHRARRRYWDLANAARNRGTHSKVEL